MFHQATNTIFKFLGSIANVVISFQRLSSGGCKPGAWCTNIFDSVSERSSPAPMAKQDFVLGIILAHPFVAPRDDLGFLHCLGKITAVLCPLQILASQSGGFSLVFSFRFNCTYIASGPCKPDWKRTMLMLLMDATVTPLIGLLWWYTCVSEDRRARGLLPLTPIGFTD